MTKPKCCGEDMAKAGSAWSGNTKVPQWRCNQCGRRTIVNKEVK